MTRATLQFFLGLGNTESLKIETDRTGRWEEEDLSGVTRVVMALSDDNELVVELDSDVTGSGVGEAFDWTTVPNQLVMALGAALSAAGVAAGRYDGRLVLYGTIAGATYAAGWVATDDLMVEVS